MKRNKRYTVKTDYKLDMMELLHADWFHVDGEWRRIWKVNPLLKFVICYGGFTDGVFQTASDYNHGMYNVR
jgi:hypothetical protein